MGPMNTTTSNDSMSHLNDNYKQQLVQIVAASRNLREQIQTAKTGTKRAFYTKKLHTNNELAFRLLLKLSRTGKTDDEMQSILDDVNDVTA